MKFFGPILRMAEAGGHWIIWPIFCASLIVWWIGLWKLYSVRRVRISRKRFMKLVRREKSLQNPGDFTGDRCYDDLLAHLSGGSFDKTGLRERSKEFLLDMTASLNAGFTTMAVWISVAPLLGLLGTVIGMMETFRVITVYGAGNPSLTAEGISIALITTEAGLTAAFPGMVLHLFASNRKNSLLRLLRSDVESIAAIAAEQKRTGADAADV